MRGRLLLRVGSFYLLGCSAPAQVLYEEDLARTPPPAAHAVYSDRLGELMQSLEGLSRDRLPRAMDVRGEEERRADEIAAVARAMADSAGQIADAGDELGLAALEREEFLALGGELHRLCQQLADEAPALALGALRARAREITDTCDRCHARFRIPREAR